MFDPEGLVADCRATVAGGDGKHGVREILARCVAEPGAVLAALGEPQRAGITRLYHGPDVTVLNVVWGPMMAIMPHNHLMWAVIGVYTGREDNIFWRRVGSADGRIEAAAARALSVGDCALLGHDAVHSVTNPIPRLTGAIHIYGGDFFGTAKSEWDPETLCERPYDVPAMLRLFEAANGGPGRADA
jgi:predicted metal-dependent enzyme (double-stranded beta helix superfamily)